MRFELVAAVAGMENTTRSGSTFPSNCSESIEQGGEE